MAKDDSAPPGPMPPAPHKSRRSANFGGYTKQDVGEYEEHAKEIRSLASGRDIVESLAGEMESEKRPAAFDRHELQVVRSWVKGRPLEPSCPASALIEYPRDWTTKRGRYANFALPGSGTYGLLRARPTW